VIGFINWFDRNPELSVLENVKLSRILQNTKTQKVILFEDGMLIYKLVMLAIHIHIGRQFA
jgi:hypothetical protein